MVRILLNRTRARGRLDRSYAEAKHFDRDLAPPDSAIVRHVPRRAPAHNAGIFIPKPFAEYSEADFANVLSVNLAGSFHVSRGLCGALPSSEDQRSPPVM